MPNPWFRLYSRIMTDPKIEMLSFEDQRHYVWLLCMKNEGYLDEKFPHSNGACNALPNDGSNKKNALVERMIGRKLGLQGEAFEGAKLRLIEVGLIDENWQPLKWDELQFVSDQDLTRNERQRRHREKKRNALPNAQITPLEQIQNRTDTDKEKDQKTLVHPPKKKGDAPSQKKTGKDYSDDFLHAWSIYPKRSGSNSKVDAYTQWKSRMTEKDTMAEIMTAGVMRYAAWCEATGKVGTETVMQAERFFGKGRHFEDEYEIAPVGENQIPGHVGINNQRGDFSGYQQRKQKQGEGLDVLAKFAAGITESGPSDNAFEDFIPGSFKRLG